MISIGPGITKARGITEDYTVHIHTNGFTSLHCLSAKEKKLIACIARNAKPMHAQKWTKIHISFSKSVFWCETHTETRNDCTNWYVEYHRFLG